MPFSYDLQSDDAAIQRISKVRKHLPIKAGGIFDDAEILDFLADVPVKYGAASYEATVAAVEIAAAWALKAIGRSEAHIQKVQETLALKTDGAALSREYRLSADSLLGDVKDAKKEYLSGLEDLEEDCGLDYVSLL